MLVAGIRRKHGPVETFDVADPRTLHDGEALIEVRAAGVGNWDDIVRVGDWDVGRTPPMALGVEAAGVVAALGPGVERWSVGDEVLTHPLPLADQGTWAPWLIAPAALLAARPASMAWAIAGAFSVPALTAVQVLDEVLQLRPGDSLLVNGAGGVTGGVIVSLAAAHRGIHVLATAGPASREHVARAGAAMIVDYHDASWPDQILDATGGAGVDAAANAARGGAATALRAVRDGGRLATITSDPPERQREIQIASVYVRPDAAQLEMACQAFDQGHVDFVLGSSFTLPDAAAALALAVRGGGGAIVLEL